MAKALFFLIAREGGVGQLKSMLTESLVEQFTGQSHVTVQLMQELPNDVFYNEASPYRRPQLILEVIASPGKPMAELHDVLTKVLDQASIDRSESLVLLMQERKFIPSSPQKIYYHYLMIKRQGFSMADYLDYYTNLHFRFGMHTPAIEGYSQNYVDQASSEGLASLLGLSCREVTSISEMKMPSLMDFLGDPGILAVAEPAAIDEAYFVDRNHSVMFCSEVIFQMGDFHEIDEPVHDQCFSA